MPTWRKSKSYQEYFEFPLCFFITEFKNHDSRKDAKHETLKSQQFQKQDVETSPLGIS
jgi:hypothetical protein